MVCLKHKISDRLASFLEMPELQPVKARTDTKNKAALMRWVFDWFIAILITFMFRFRVSSR
jgi:hypothetical protein